MNERADAEAREIVEPFLNRALVLYAPNSEVAVRVLDTAAKQARVRAVAILRRRDDALARAAAAERERIAAMLEEKARGSSSKTSAFLLDILAAQLRATPAGAETRPTCFRCGTTDGVTAYPRLSVALCAPCGSGMKRASAGAEGGEA